MVPPWLHWLSLASLVFGAVCATLIAIDELRRPQPMWIMNVVWPVTALSGAGLVVWHYRAHGRARPRGGQRQRQTGEEETPLPTAAADAALHCGSGCTLGDICAEWLAFFLPAVAVWFGWHSLFQTRMFAVWGLDFVFAYVFGIVFQYFTIAPMRGLSFGAGVVAAVKADTLSLAAWQVGMYGFMAFAVFVVFQRGFGTGLEVDSTEFWFMMQLAMICGFATAYPVNRWLIRAGIKERM